ncbi:MAG: 3-dehydroquinate synthase [Clostridia bacterium]|nr:3-dehydroquinate synthase [Clostridia bacterium]
MRTKVNLAAASYEILIERGCLNKAGEELDLKRKVMIVTDEGVPAEYAKCVAEQCEQPYIVTVGQGEANKTMESLQKILMEMLENGFSRKDCVVAVGGGMVGDLAGFSAASYMRGIDFYNIPTTVLSQVDSSIGGKTGINFGGVKNIVGAFWQPKKVLIDTDTTASLTKREVAAGLAESFKMSACLDPELFEEFETVDVFEQLDHIVHRAIESKRRVVEEDERETGLRKVLNFGHTLGHGIEVACGESLYHGECVAIGMMPMCSPQLKERMLKVYEKLGLPSETAFDEKKALEAITHDKKGASGGVSAVLVSAPGEFEFKKMSYEELGERLSLVNSRA